MKTSVTKRTISIDEEVSRKGDARAEQEHRNFSNYVAWLIKEDVSRRQRDAQEQEVSE